MRSTLKLPKDFYKTTFMELTDSEKANFRATRANSYRELRRASRLHREFKILAKGLDTQYTGRSVTDTSHHIEKRFAPEPASLAFSVFSFLFNLGYKVYEEHQRQLLMQRVNEFMIKTDKVTQDFISFKNEQYSFNQIVRNQLFNLTRTVEKNGVRLEVANTVSTMQTVQFEVQELIGYLQLWMQAIVDADKGKVSPAFLKPSDVQQVMEEFSSSGKYDKSFFSTDQVLQLYSMTYSSVFFAEGTITVLNLIRIPTSQTVGLLYRVQSFPVYESKEDLYVQVEVENKFLAVNDESQFVELGKDDVALCDSYRAMTICEPHDDVWEANRRDSCTASIFFMDQQSVAEHCNFKTVPVEDEDIPKPVQIIEGVFHFALDRDVSLSRSCEERPGFEISTENGNGFIHLASQCQATFGVGGHLLRNSQIFTFINRTEVVASNELNLTAVALVKNDFVSKDDFENRVTLENDEVLESIKQQEQQEQFLDEIEEAKDEAVEEAQEMWLKNLDSVLEKQRVLVRADEAIEAKIADSRQNYEENNTWTWMSFIIAVLSLALLIVLSLFVVCIFWRQCNTRGYINQHFQRKSPGSSLPAFANHQPVQEVRPQVQPNTAQVNIEMPSKPVGIAKKHGGGWRCNEKVY